MNLKKASGFTLIELIVVIVILGIMAAIAGPKFVNLQSEARTSVMQGVEGAIRSTATLVYSKSLIEGEEGNQDNCAVAADCQVAVPGGLVITEYGYPNSDTLQVGLELQADVTPTVAGAAVTFAYNGRADCQVVYTEPAGPGLSPTIALTSTGC